MGATSLTYRPEIDGLRAIAVLSVLLYHAEFVVAGEKLFSGGFIGVDIFFVISGFLITRIIANDIEAGQFSLVGFYERRARRILPALLLVVLATVPFAYVYLMPAQLVEYAWSIVSTLLFYSNIFFWWAGEQYAADASLLKPLLHTWSLSVEEQFYIFFPPLMVLLAWRPKVNRLVVLGALVVVSLLGAHWFSSVNGSANFFMTPSRIWELGAGVILALASNQKVSGLKTFQRDLVQGVCLALIGAFILFANDQIQHPSLYTAIAVFAVLPLIFIPNPDGLVFRVMASTPMVKIGLISYSLYLWHFPIFAFARVSGGEPTNTEKIYLLVFTFILSYLSYRFVEQPFRTKAKVPIKAFAISAAAVLVLTITPATIMIRGEGLVGRLPPLLQAGVKSEKPWEIVREGGSRCYNRISDHCEFGPTGAKPIFLMGDSQIATMASAFVRFSKKNDYRLVLINNGGCPYAPSFDRVDHDGKTPRHCNQKQQHGRREMVLQHPGSYVVMGGRYPLFFSEEYFDNGEGGVEQWVEWGYFKHHTLDSSDFVTRRDMLADDFKFHIRELLERNINVILVYPIPEVGVDVPLELNNRIRQYQEGGGGAFQEFFDRGGLSTSYARYKERTAYSFKVFDDIEHPNLIRVYPHEIFCDSAVKGRCVTHDRENVFYADDDHLSEYGSSLLADVIFGKINERTDQTAQNSR